MDDTNVGFCNDSFEKEQISNLINKHVINLPVIEINKIYEHFIDEFEKDNVYCKTLVHPVGKIRFPFEILPDWELFGIDFPSWFGNYSNKKLMVIGIDPLRNIKTFENYGAKKDSEVIIGTPYALHDKKMRAGKTKIYWDFVNRLSKENFVYLTDVHKIFFQNTQGYKSGDYFEWKNDDVSKIQKVDRELLEKEIEQINPDLIILFGQKVHYNFWGERNKIAKKIELRSLGKNAVISMVHLSGATRNEMKATFIRANNDNENYIVDNNFALEYYKIVSRYL